MKFYTYLHRKADTGDIFYVGKGSGNRLNGALQRSQYWKSVVKKHGFTAEICQIWSSDAEAFEHERKLISTFRKQGIRLCNLTDGGLGGIGRVISTEEREKRAVIQAQVWKRPGHRDRHSEKTKGKKVTEEACRNISASLVGKRLSPLRCSQMSEFQKIRQNLPEVKAANSALNKGKKMDRTSVQKSAVARCGANNDRSKPILCVGAELRVFESGGRAIAWLKENGFPKASAAAISRVCRGKFSTAYGYRWEFACL